MAGDPPRLSLIGPKNTRCVAVGECCSPASDRSSSTLREETSAVICSRPVAVGLAFPRLARLPIRACDREAGNDCGVAPQIVPDVLDVGNPERQARAAGRPTRGSPPIRRMSRENPRWGEPRIHGELLTLCISIGETSEQISGAQSQAAVPDREDLPREPPQKPRIRRLLHCPDHPVSGPVCVSSAGTRPAANCAFRCHGTSDCRMDGSQSFPSPLSAPRSRPHLWA